MSIKLALTSKQILEKEFPGATPGYNSLLVDQFLDKILKDYRLMEENQLVETKEYDSMIQKINSLEEENQRLRLENERMNLRVKNIKNADNVTSENVNLLKRIDALERFIFDKGFDPNKIV